jgi:hypothetical protein
MYSASIWVRQLPAFTADLEVRLIGMESCRGAHFLGSALREAGRHYRKLAHYPDDPAAALRDSR